MPLGWRRSCWTCYSKAQRKRITYRGAIGVTDGYMKEIQLYYVLLVTVCKRVPFIRKSYFYGSLMHQLLLSCHENACFGTPGNAILWSLPWVQQYSKCFPIRDWVVHNHQHGRPFPHFKSHLYKGIRSDITRVTTMTLDLC